MMDNEYLRAEDPNEPIPGGRTNLCFAKMFAKVILAIITFAALWFCVSLTSCYTAKKAERQVVKAGIKYPEVTATYCANIFPPKESVKESVVYKEGETITVPGETVYVNCDSAIKYVTNVKMVPVKCPPSTVKTDTIYLNKTITVENTAKIDAQNIAIDKLNKEVIKASDSLNTWRLVAIITSGILLIMLLIRILIRKTVI